jgi:hypothetical protein
MTPTSATTHDTAVLCRELVIAANRALRDNPLMTGVATLYPLDQGRALPALMEWLAAGIPFPIICAAVVDVCARFTPTKASPRIASFKYFEHRVREGFAQHQATADIESAGAGVALAAADPEQVAEYRTRLARAREVEDQADIQRYIELLAFLGVKEAA